MLERIRRELEEAEDVAWVRVAIRRPGASSAVETSAKLNTGFTIGPEPFIRLPGRVAERET